jgi:hypothetical protein
MDHTVTIPPELIDRATIAGQVTIFQQQQVQLMKPIK